MLNYNKVTLKAVEESDLESLRNWRNNPSLRKYFRDVQVQTRIYSVARTIDGLIICTNPIKEVYS